MLEQALVVASAAIALSLGLIHLVYTFVGSKLEPRDPSLQVRMSDVPLVLTRQTTVWKAWIGFNASHALGIILFGTSYGYLALVQPEVLFQSTFLVSLGALLFLSCVLLAKID